MSKSFYKYLVNNLIIGNLRELKPVPGSRYYFVLENEEKRKDLMQALRETGSEIEISNIFRNGSSSETEEPYKTVELEIGENLPRLIIGTDDSATEDYLTTMRNMIGSHGSPYENYCALFILSGSGLSSIVTACQDLEGFNAPLSTDSIVRTIKAGIEERIAKKHEEDYLKFYVDKLGSYIEDGSCDLFDFKEVLTVLNDEKLEGHFNELGFFNDSLIYDNSFNPSDGDKSKRIEQNHSLFQSISEIMERDETESEKIGSLQKYLDEKGARELIKLKDLWRAHDFKHILESIDRKNSTSKLALCDISLANPSDKVKLYKCQTGKIDKKSKSYVIVCDASGAPTQDIKLEFNQKLGTKNKPSNTVIRNNEAIITIGEEFHASVWGKDNNSHEVKITRIPCNEDFLCHIDNFTVKKEGKKDSSCVGITIVVPEDSDSVIFGKGTSAQSIPVGDPLVWEDSYILSVPTPEEDDVDKVDFSLLFGDKQVNFHLKYNVAKRVPPMAPGDQSSDKEYYEDETSKVPFEKITDGENSYSTLIKWRPYLYAEQKFVKSGATTLVYCLNPLTQEYDIETKQLELPGKVKESYARIIKHYQDKGTVPSLAILEEDTITLYKDYLHSIEEVVYSIEGSQNLSIQAFNISRLGIVEKDGKVYLSPFHPLLVAYTLQYKLMSGYATQQTIARKLLSPFYLLPFIYYNEIPQQPYSDEMLSDMSNWLAFEKLTGKGMFNSGLVTAKMVKSRIADFIRHFDYLFQDKECPIILNSIGVKDDAYLIKGIVEFIMQSYSKGVQRIELHAYVENIREETFFERLNRLATTDAIARELEDYGVDLNRKGEFDAREIIHMLFTRVSYYKHELSKGSPKVGYCHISFYQINTGDKLIPHSIDLSRNELSLDGLISIPSTTKEGDKYIIGYGHKGTEDGYGELIPITKTLNVLYANCQNGPNSPFLKDVCVAKRFDFTTSNLLDSVYENSNWVTFLNPEVDINFFYRQKDVYLVHYTDQITLNAKYDSITVTRHIDQYRNLLKRPYERLGLSQSAFEHFNNEMMSYFNCLNGSWMLSVLNKPEPQVREKMSLVSASIAMLRFLKRTPGIIWIPISLEEILRVTPNVGLKKDFIFSKSSLGASGPMSDDLLMIGLDASDGNALKLYLYPVEVKFSQNKTTYKSKASAQVVQTFKELRDNLIGEASFIKNIYRTFFASQYLNNADKLHANSLITEENYQTIEEARFKLLNLAYTIEEWLPVRKLGNAAILSYHDNAEHKMSTSIHEGVAVCGIEISDKECFQAIAEPDSNVLDFIEEQPIMVDAKTSAFLDNPTQNEEEESFEGADEEDSIDEESSPETEENVNITSVATVENEEVAIEEAEVGNSTDSGPSSINIILGKAGQTDVIFEPNNTVKVSHPNMGIIGTMGTGKTQLARSIIAQFSKESIHNIDHNPIGLLVFDYKGDYRDNEFLNAVNGKAYRFNYPFNPLKLVVTQSTEGMNLPAITADRISDSLAKAYGLGLKQQANIKKVIIDTYADFGITRDSSTWGKVPPTMENVIAKYFETYDANDKSYALFDKLQDYTIFSPDNSNCVSLFEWLDRARVIDLTMYPDDTKKVIVSLILDLFYAEMQQLGGSKQEQGFRQLRAMIMVDEAHQFLKKDFNSLRKIISEGRMFGVGMILSTQNVGDFKTSQEDYTQFILSWMIHHVANVTNSELASIFGAGNPHLEKFRSFINKAQIFESVCKLGNYVTSVRDLPFFELIKSDNRFKRDEV